MHLSLSNPQGRELLPPGLVAGFGGVVKVRQGGVNAKEADWSLRLVHPIESSAGSLQRWSADQKQAHVTARL